MNDAGQASEIKAYRQQVEISMSQAMASGAGPPGRSSLGLRDLVQWTARQGLYFPSGQTIEALPVGCYRFVSTEVGIALEEVQLASDELICFPDGACAKVLSGIQNFWARKREFQRRGQLFKRGVLLCGAAGSGKTSIVMLLAQQVMQLGGMVTVTERNGSALAGLSLLRKVEPKRPIVNIIEDIEELIESDGERQMLSLLDGEAQVENIVHVGTTNHPERLGARIIKRPSRFDEIIEVPLPDEAARRLYLMTILRRDDLKKADFDRWVDATEGMSFAFLRELAVAVFCLGCEFESVLERLHEMLQKPDSIEEWPRKQIGLSPPEPVRKVGA